MEKGGSYISVRGFIIIKDIGINRLGVKEGLVRKRDK